MSDPPMRFGREFRAGEVLFREGEQGDEMYVVQSGLVRILKRVGREERPLATLLKARGVPGRDGHLELAPALGHGGGARRRQLPRHRRRDAGADDPSQSGDCAPSREETGASAGFRQRGHPDFAAPRPESAGSDGLEKLHAEGAIDVGEEGGSIGAVELAREVGVEEMQVLDVLTRLNRLQVTRFDERGAVVVSDVSRLLEFMEFLDMPTRSES